MEICNVPILMKSRRGGRKRSSAIRRRFVVGKQETLRALAHDARSVVATLGLCCDLLGESGVLREGQETLAMEMRQVALTSAALICRMASFVAPDASREMAPVTSAPIDDLADAVRQLERPLAALVGPQIQFEMECLSCFGGIRLLHEDLTRILINLTRNAAEAMPQGGRIRVTVQQGNGGSFLDTLNPARTVLLCVQDSGPGISADQAGRIFEAGFTTREEAGVNRGLGLNIVKRLVENAGGKVRAITAPGGGARFEVGLPLIHSTKANSEFMADFTERTNLEC
jgi:signal transduction histidine kinase